MTDKELRDQTVRELRLTTVGYVNNKWKTPPAGSHWANAMAGLSQIGAVTPPPPPPPEARPFAADSPWNTRIGASPTLHAHSADYIRYLAALYPANRSFTCDVDQFTFAVYEVPLEQPTVTVNNSFSLRYVDSNNVVQVDSGNTAPRIPIPPGAAPPEGSDAQFIIIQGTTVWDIFQAEYAHAQGAWHANGIIRSSTTFPGWVDRNVSNPYTQRGAGIPYLGGLVRKWEVDQGRIDHALACAWVGSGVHKGWVAPASKSDGDSLDAYALPEGARLQLNPSFDINRIASPVGRIIAQAAKDYGMLLIDNGGSPKIYLEYRDTAGWDTTGANAVDATILTGMKLSDFRVITFGSITVD
jgi:hypothetical protein